MSNNNHYQLTEVNAENHEVGSLSWWSASDHEYNFSLLATYENEHGTATQYGFDHCGYEPFDGEDEAPGHQPCIWRYASDGVNEWPHDIRTYTKRSRR